MKIAIIDTLGLCYDGSTLSKRGLGGSESAVILMSKELAKLGADVTVFNDCTSDDAKPGVYDDVGYQPLINIQNIDTVYDVVIGSRSVAAFAPYHMLHEFKTFSILPSFDLIMSKAKHKVLWMHDTFCDGDQYLEDFLLEGRIDEIFTLSDFHTSYAGNCNHGRMRMFEVMKKKIFQTRNGIGNKKDWVDVQAKDPDLFVYNSSVTKGMIPLVTKIWPKIKQQIPTAKLKVIGGYYKFRENAEPDQQEQDWRKLVAEYSKLPLDIEFTGIIKQSEISNILTDASYMIYPAAFPETFGISTLEALAHNVPLITCDFGALEETAIDLACYKIPYPIEPNGLFPWIPSDIQVDRFVSMAVRAHQDKYLHQQKMYACNQVKDLVGWDTIALQWKQHFHRVLGSYMPIDEYRAVADINNKVHKVFGRRFMNQEEITERRSVPGQQIVVVTPVYNAENYIVRCIESVVSQDYDNYKMIIIDDASTDGTAKNVYTYLNSLPDHLKNKITFIRNKENVGAVCNQITTIRNSVAKSAVVMLLDGDDWLVNNPNIFSMYNNLYNKDAWFTYGSCWSVADNIPLIAQPYPPEVIKNKTYREHKFNWNMPYTHLRTFNSLLLEIIDDDVFKDEDGKWLRAGGDTAIFYNLIEAVPDPEKSIICISDIVYNYNDANPLNDYKVNGEEQTKTAKKVTTKMNGLPPVPADAKMEMITGFEEPEARKRVLIAIPTARYIEPETFKSIYDLKIPHNVDVDFQFFYGYNVDQVRNLIANWTINGYDYLFAVDHDISFEPNTLAKMLAHDVDIVSGVYRQRLDNQTLELYDATLRNIPYEVIHNKGLIPIGACGFGCVLVKKHVFEKVGYPQFVYHDAIDHKNTFSEDLDFCTKAAAAKFELYADTSILCKHKGDRVFEVELPKLEPVRVVEDPQRVRLRELGDTRLLPPDHTNYLLKMSADGIKPKVIYDIGACVLHWTREAVNAWPEAQYVVFEAMDATEFLYNEFQLPHVSGTPLYREDNVVLEFNENTYHPGGNSIYDENPELSPLATEIFTKKTRRVGMTLDTLVAENKFPLPDLIKMDIQGAELDALMGATKTLTTCKDLILELQHKDYNQGAALANEVIEYLEDIGFKLVGDGMFCGSELGVDGDYHFTRRK